MKNLITEMEAYALEKNIPIIEKESIAFIMKYIKANKIENILEIGSAIGYSSILMASCNQETNITTIERDEVRYMECLKNVKKSGLENKINVVYQDALNVNLSEEIEYNLIFIDAAKAQYINFFEKFKHFLAPGGIIITDNINFHGHRGKSDQIESKNLKALVQKLENYVEFLNTNTEFTTKYYDLGDGIAVSVKNEVL